MLFIPFSVKKNLQGNIWYKIKYTSENKKKMTENEKKWLSLKINGFCIYQDKEIFNEFYISKYTSRKC